MPTSNKQPALAWQVNLLSDSATALVARGQLEDAAKVYEQILDIAPYQLAALDFLATRAFENGDLKSSLELLTRAIRAKPERPVAYQNLAIVYKAQGELENALTAIDRALDLQPVFPVALIHKGSILEGFGQQVEAVRAYLKAWTYAPYFQEKRLSPQTPEHVRKLLFQSADAINQARFELLDKAYAQLRAQFSPAELGRADQFANTYLGRTQAHYTHAMQRPAYLYFPELQPRAFFEREEFSWVKELESATVGIRQELLALLQQPDLLEPYVQLTVKDTAQWQGLNHSPDWSSYHLYKGGERNATHCKRCPMTADVLEKLPLIHTPGQSPEAFFSILKPGTHIPPHHGLANFKIAVHLPLIVPGDCAIRVGNETHTWTEGQCLFFDDSFQHEAWNDSEELRAVLILEVWNPQLSDAEHQAVTAVLGVIRDFERKYGNQSDTAVTNI